MRVRSDSPALANLAKDFSWGRKFIVWIGSGLSVPAGLPTWQRLRQRLETRLSAAAARKLPDLTPTEAQSLVAHIRKLPNPWEAFEILKLRLGDAEYRQVLLLALDDSGVQPPRQLSRIWSNPNVDGVISLNIDNLASRAFSEVNRGQRELARATGLSLGLGLRYLSGYQPFLVQLHGRVEDEASWVFTKSELDALFSRSDYEAFVRGALTARRVLFIGCSPDDVAVIKHFHALSRISDHLPDHYWFVPSHEMTAARENDLGKLGVSLIEYDIERSATPALQNAQHEEALHDLFNYLEAYQYSEPEPDPINPMAGPIGAKLPPDRVQALAPEQARNLLSRYATVILEEPGNRRHENYQEFLQAYGPAIAVASYVPKNVATQVFGHSVSGELGEGAFSRVLKATAPDGSTARAIKLVRSEVRDDPVMLRSFRRGVRSMQILSEKGVAGMVAYDQAYEIPPCVIMPFVDGDNLEELARRPRFSFLSEGLPIMRRVAEIVYSAHDLPERVLHRDLRPSNIMIRRDDTIGTIESRVVVLDFDLSWHEGADADSPISPNMTTVLGYLAPEQIANDLSVSARNAKVDTYGICMTIYYLMQRQHPDFRAREGKDWSELRNRLGKSLEGASRWLSLLSRLRRLVHYGTEADQTNRLDFDVVVRELELLDRLRELSLGEVGPSHSTTIPMEAIGEEILSRGLKVENYEWSSRSGAGRHIGALGIGLSVAVAEQDSGRGIRVSSVKDFDGTQSFATVKKYWGERRNEVTAIMRRGGWEGEASRSQQQIVFSFFAPEAVVWSDPVRLSNALGEAWKKLSMI